VPHLSPSKGICCFVLFLFKLSYCQLPIAISLAFLLAFLLAGLAFF
jgi:hypothetical protein